MSTVPVDAIERIHALAGKYLAAGPRARVLMSRGIGQPRGFFRDKAGHVHPISEGHGGGGLFPAAPAFGLGGPAAGTHHVAGDGAGGGAASAADIAKIHEAASQAQVDGWYEKSEVPPGWFVHGRADRQDLKTGFAVQGTQDVDVADQYAGKRGSVWYVRPKPGAKLMDFADPDIRAKVVDRLAADHEDGTAPEMYDRAVSEHGEDGAKVVMDKELDVPDIVDAAGPFDDAGFVSWLWERFEPDAAMVGHKRGEGVVVLNNDPSAIETRKVSGTVGGNAGQARRMAAGGA